MNFSHQVINEDAISPPLATTTTTAVMKPREYQGELPDISNTTPQTSLSPLASSCGASSIDEEDNQNLDHKFSQEISHQTTASRIESEHLSPESIVSINNNQQYQLDLEHIENMAHQNSQHIHHHHQQQQQQQQQQNRINLEAGKLQPEQTNRNEFDEVKHVDLFGVQIVALTINGRERLCLAQISNTLLKEFSYNEIHNRRVALGITCVQCTPVQLEMLRRAGAMPSSSRRCGMITMREAERLCRSFLVEEQPPELPENFYFTIAHRVNYGCKGRFIPARYISSRAKCIECFYCGEFYSPNKFIFHSHKQPNRSDCNPPDSPNINSWRKHIDLDYGQEHSQEIKYAWEDVKSLFNGGTRRRAPNNPNGINISSGNGPTSTVQNRVGSELKRQPDDDQLIDVELFDESLARKNQLVAVSKSNETAIRLTDQEKSLAWSSEHLNKANCKMNTSQEKQKNQLKLKGAGDMIHDVKPLKRPASGAINHHVNKRFVQLAEQTSTIHHNDNIFNASQLIKNDLNMMAPFPSPGSSAACSTTLIGGKSNIRPQSNHTIQSPLLISDHLINKLTRGSNRDADSVQLTLDESNGKIGSPGINYSSSVMNIPNNNPTNFIYSQLYSQLMQPQAQQSQLISNQQLPQRPAITDVDAQLALRHHIWSSILANLQCNAAAAAVASANQNRSSQNLTQTYSLSSTGSLVGQQQQNPSNHLINSPEQQYTSAITTRDLSTGDSRLGPMTASNYNMVTISSQPTDNSTDLNALRTTPVSTYNNNDNCSSESTRWHHKRTWSKEMVMDTYDEAQPEVGRDPARNYSP